MEQNISSAWNLLYCTHMLVCRKTSEHRQKTLSGHVVLLGRRDVLIFRPFFSFWPICTFDGFDINRRQGRQGESFMVYNLSGKNSNLVQQGSQREVGTKLIFAFLFYNIFYLTNWEHRQTTTNIENAVKWYMFLFMNDSLKTVEMGCILKTFLESNKAL